MALPILEVSFYESSTDGPTLRLAGTSAGMRIIRDACEALADGVTTVALLDLDGVRLSGAVKSVEFRLGGDDGLCRQAGDPAAFIFDGDQSQWTERAHLLNPLVHPGTPDTVQFLEPDLADGICVEAAVTR